RVKKVAVVVLAVALLLLFSAFVPVFAKNFNYPEGQLVHYSSGGEGYVAVPAGSFGAATSLKIQLADVQIGTYGHGDTIGINFLWQKPDGSSVYIPIAWFTSNPNPDVITWLKTALSGFPVSLSNNIRYVSDDVLMVDRHGNSITAELVTPQTVMLMGQSGPISLVVPAFTVELNKVGGSVHKETTLPLTGYPGASGWTGYIKETGFNAEGAFTCQAWSYNSEPMTDCFIAMQQIVNYVPPASP
ncbi:TPA: hypothetical protein HA273_00720, partial [Candidatus Bathyarchaeota archaeon]|nr:hypothetical protein [Candidatus Bathyarchaeota archaeon]